MPTVLVENHSLKNYRQRVLGTYVLVEAALKLVGDDAAALRTAITYDRAAKSDLAWPGREKPIDTSTS